MRKIMSIIMLILLISVSGVNAEEHKVLKYKKADKPFDYGNENVLLAVEKGTDKIIPLSIGPLDGYTYAYLPNDGEIEIKEIKPIKFFDAEDGGFRDLYMAELSARGVFLGYSDGTFKKEELLTRAETAAAFSRLFDVSPENEKSGYSDVPDDSWYCGYVNALSKKGVFDKDTEFYPDKLITREQLVTMTYRMLSDMGFIYETDESNHEIYKDINELSEYARNCYKGLIENGYRVICDRYDNVFWDTEDDEIFFAPQKNVTRYECAEYLYDLIRQFTSANAPAILRENADPSEIPVLDGSTSTYNITQNIYRRYYKNEYNCPDMPKKHSKTSNSYKRLIDGEVEMIFVPDPSEEIKNYAKEKGVKLKYVPIANEALVFFTSDKNKTDNITSKDLYDIYVKNSIKNWNEIGKETAELMPFCRNADSGSHAQMEKFILNGNNINEDISKEHTSWIMSSIITDVEDFNRQNLGKFAMGYSLYFYYQNIRSVLGSDELKLLSVDSVEATEENIARGIYPYTTNYYAVVREEENEKVDAFLKLLKSEVGDEIIECSGLGVIAKD